MGGCSWPAVVVKIRELEGPAFQGVKFIFKFIVKPFEGDHGIMHEGLKILVTIRHKS